MTHVPPSAAARELAVCPQCPTPRDPTRAQCPSCGASWALRVVLLSAGEAAGVARVAEYLRARSARADEAERRIAALDTLPAVVADQQCEQDARRIWRELEGLGVHVAIERDVPGAAAINRRPPSRHLPALTAVALLLLAGSVALHFLDPIPDETRTRRSPQSVPLSPALAASAQDTRPESAQPQQPDAPSPPTDIALAAVSATLPDGRVVAGAVIDVAGWVMLPADALPDDATLEVVSGGQPATAKLMRRDPVTQLGLFRLDRAAPFALSLGDATRLRADAQVFRLHGADGRLSPDAVLRPDQRVGPQAYLRLADTSAGVVAGTPVVTGNGLLVGVIESGASARAGLPVATPVNWLIEGPASLLSLALPPREPSAEFRAWLVRTDRADRAERPELYQAVEQRLYVALRCASVCEAEVALAQFVLGGGANPVKEPSLAGAFLDVEQPQDDGRPRFGRTAHLTPLDGWRWSRRLDPLIESTLSPTLAARLTSGELPGLLSGRATLRFPRPRAARGAAFRVVITSDSGRSSPPLLVGPSL